MDTKAKWFSAGTDEPRDQQRDVDGPGYHWALVGPSHPDGWDWSVIHGSDTVAGARVCGEEEAKSAVADWERDNR